MNKPSEKLKVKGEKYKICATDFEGITLVALVITIIVLIILAGVSINAVMNQGLITNAKDASDEFDKEKTKEEDVLSYLDAVAKYANEEIKNVDTTKTNPEAALPEGAVIMQGDANKGIVIKDTNNNEWVWVEVPKDIYTTAINNEDYENIEKDMAAYAVDYRVTSYEDIWYEGCGFEDDDTKTGEEKYNEHKNSMLKSVYDYGGFWIGRYEAGTRTARYAETDALTEVVIQQNMYPYNGVTTSQAQERTSMLSIGGKTGSLMFGIQWDLTMKFLEEKGAYTAEDGTLTDITYEMLATVTTGSTAFGNYMNAAFTMNRGKYTISPNTVDSWIDYNVDTAEYVVEAEKQLIKSVLLTTGAVDRNSTLNIYDIAGNTWERTLEQYTQISENSPCVGRGGGMYNYGGGAGIALANSPAYARANCSLDYTEMVISFRPVLW